MNEFTDLVQLDDILSIPKDILQEIAINLSLPTNQTSIDLALSIWARIENDQQLKRSALNIAKNIIFSGRTSLTWYSVGVGESLLGAREKIIESCGFNPFEMIIIPPIDEITSEPVVIGGALCEKSSDYYLRLIYKSGVKRLFRGNDPINIPVTDIKTVYINEEHNCIEIRTDARSSNKFATCIAKMLNQQISITQTDILAPYGYDIEEIVDRLDGELIDATGKPEMVLESIGDNQVEAIQEILAALDLYFQNGDINQLGQDLEQAKQKFGDDIISIPFIALILCGLEKIGFGVTNSDLRKIPAYNLFKPHVQNQGGFIRFSLTENGVNNTYTIRVGLNTKSIYFMTPATENAIRYVRERIIY